MTIMLKGVDRVYYTRNMKGSRAIEEAVHLLRRRYNNRDKKYRLLNEWKGMSLTRAMKDGPNGSEVGVFQTFVVRMLSIQAQLTSSYQGDRYLKDWFQEKIDLPSVEDF